MLHNEIVRVRSEKGKQIILNYSYHFSPTLRYSNYRRLKLNSASPPGMNILLSNNLPNRSLLLPSHLFIHPTDLPPPCCANLRLEPRCINHSVHGHYGQNQRYPLSFIPTRLRNIFYAPDGNTAFIRQVIPMHTYNTDDGAISLLVEPPRFRWTAKSRERK